MALSIEDRLELMALPARYGNALDDRDWPTLAAIFTEDATFEVLPLELRLDGLAEIHAFMDATSAHPLAHIMTNVAIEGRGGATQMRFRGILPFANQPGMIAPGGIIIVYYYDEVVKTAAGWRVSARQVTRAPRAMKPTATDIATNHGLAQLFAIDQAR